MAMLVSGSAYIFSFSRKKTRLLVGEFGEVGRDRRGTLLRVDLRFEQRLQLLTFDTFDTSNTQDACGK